MTALDPYSFEHEFDGGVLGKDVENGKRRARISLGPEGIRARTEDGQELALPWRGVRLERGGATGRVVFCHGPGRRLSVFSEDPEFLRALEGAAGNEVVDDLARLAGASATTRRRHAVGCIVAAIGGAALVYALLVAVPRAYRSAVNGAVSALPYSIDESIGELVLEQMDPGGEEVEDEVVIAAVQTMLDRLAPYASLGEAEFQFRIIHNEQVNAFALPGGHLTVYTGLLREAEHPEMVAGVLAHEIAHVTERHGLRRIGHSVGLWLGIQLVLGDAEGLLGLAAELFTLASINEYSQGQETEADLEGARMLHAAGIDPLALVDFFELIREQGGDVPDYLAWMSTHPRHAERIEALTEAAEGGEEPRPLAIDWADVQARLENL